MTDARSAVARCLTYPPHHKGGILPPWFGVSFLGFDNNDWLDQSFKNRLLDLLGPNDLEQLRPHLQPLSLEYKQVLYEPNRPIEWVHFPVTGVASLVNTMADGSAVEVGTIGNEGIVGLPIVLGDRIDPSSAYVQVPGSGLRLRASILEEKLRSSGSMRRVILHYAHAFFQPDHAIGCLCAFSFARSKVLPMAPYDP